MDAVEICNAALDMLGVDRIQSFDEESTRADLCSARFPAVRDAVLAERPWRFATARHELAEDGTAPTYGFAHRYAIPSETLQVLDVTDGTYSLDAWKREGAFILTDQEAPIFIRSTDQVDDVSLWPPGFCRAVETRLAAELCGTLTEGNATTFWQLYGMRLSEAALRDAGQGQGNRVFQGNLAARR